MTANAKYKASVFALLFSDPEPLRELYGALGGAALPPDMPITINTLQDALFMDRINDVSFEAGGKLVVLIEHQSTINPNIALRMLLYVARLYEKMLTGKNVYSTKRMALPRAEFYVLYNGKAPFPDERVMRLSDLHEEAGSPGLSGRDAPLLDLAVRVININEGRNEEMARKCRALAEYRAFIAKAREFEPGSASLGEAIRRAVRHCVERGILSGFLEKHGAEVENMLFHEWKLEDAQKAWFEDGLEEGLERGLEKGLEEGLERGMEKTARNALAEGLPMETIQKITGLDMETIAGLQANA